MYRKSFIVLSLLFIAKVFSSVNEPFTTELTIGYLQDYLNWKSLSNTSEEFIMYQEEYKNRKFLDTELTLRVLNRDIFFLVNGGIASIGSGTMKQHYSNLSYTQASPTFTFDTGGYDGHLMGLFGIAVDLTPDRINRWILIPSIGYGGYWKRVDYHSPSPSSLLLPDPPSGYNASTLHSTIDNTLEETWYGFCIGTEVDFVPNTIIFFKFDYHFSWLHLFHKSLVQLEKKDYINSVLATNTQYIQSDKVDSAGAFGHVVKASAVYRFHKKLFLSFTTQYHYFSSDKKDHINKEIETKQTYPTSTYSLLQTKDKFIARWWFLAFVLDLDFRF